MLFSFKELISSLGRLDSSRLKQEVIFLIIIFLSFGLDVFLDVVLSRYL